MSIPQSLISVISKASPVLGAALGGPAGGIVGSLISAALGVDMKNQDDVIKKLTDDPECANKLKEVELQFNDLQNARLEASKETGNIRFVRAILALLAHLSLIACIIAIEYVEDPVLSQVLLMMMIFLIWDIRQIYKFYFGNSGEIPSFLLRSKK